MTITYLFQPHESGTVSKVRRKNEWISLPNKRVAVSSDDLIGMSNRMLYLPIRLLWTLFWHPGISVGLSSFQLEF